MGSLPQVSALRGPSRPLPAHVHLSRMFEDNAANTPSDTAVIFQGKPNLTYSALDGAASRVARALLRRLQASAPAAAPAAAPREPVVAVALPPSDALLVALLATWKAGAAYLPLDLSSPARLRHILSEARPLIVIADRSQEDALAGENWVSWEDLEAQSRSQTSSPLQDTEMLPWSSSPRLALVLYTSGSTGTPKGVKLPHRMVLNRLRWQWAQFPFSTTERVCVFKTTLTFVDAVAEIWGPLLHPDPIALLVLPKDVSSDPQRLVPLLDQFKVERLLVVPTLLRAILLHLSLGDGKQLIGLKTWVCSGEPLVMSLAQQFLSQFAGHQTALCNFYGSTEIMGDVTFHVIHAQDDLAYDKVPIGRPVDNTSIYLLDTELRPVAEGEVGQLYVAGLNLCAGYINNRDPHKFISNPHTVDPDMSLLYDTGDYGRLVKGTILYEGRTDSQVKVRGNRVDLAEVDSALSKLGSVDKAAVLCYHPGEMDQAVIAYLTLKKKHIVTSDEIEKELRSHLPSYAIPQVLIIDSIPLLNNGKVDRQTLLKRYAQLAGSGEVDLSGVSDSKLAAAQCLVRTVAQVLGASVRGHLTLDASFYQLGGNSLNSVLTITQIREQGFLIGISEFISAPSLRAVVDKMVPEESNGQADSVTVLTNRPYNSEPLSSDNKDHVYRIITDSFYAKGDLEGCIEPRIPRSDYKQLLDLIWDPLVDAGLSFVLKCPVSGKVVSASLCFDVHDEPPVSLSGPLNSVFEFLEYVEAPVRDVELPQGKGQVVHAFMMGTERDLSAADNVKAVAAMEERILELGREKGYAGIFTTNTSPLTKQLGTDVFHYKVMREVQANQYTAPDGTRPFQKAADSLVVSCAWKPI